MRDVVHAQVSVQHYGSVQGGWGFPRRLDRAVHGVGVRAGSGFVQYLASGKRGSLGDLSSTGKSRRTEAEGFDFVGPGRLRERREE